MSDATVTAAAQASPLMTYKWKGRGVAPAGYTKGMSLTFAAAYRLFKGADPVMLPIVKARANDAAHDILDWYAIELAAAGAGSDTPEGRLISVFTVLLGLGIRESAGRHCDGPDTPEDRGRPGHPVPTTPRNAEAGIFQVSFDSIGQNAARQHLVDTFHGRSDLLAVFGEGARCSKPEHWTAEVGDGKEAAFQAQTKECPLFAALYAATLSRQARAHWGPLNKRRAEARSDAVALFMTIVRLIDQETP